MKHTKKSSNQKAVKAIKIASYSTPVGRFIITQSAPNMFNLFFAINFKHPIFLGFRKTERGILQFAQKKFHDKIDSAIKKTKKHVEYLENISRLSDFEQSR